MKMEKKDNVINFDDMPISNEPPRFIEDIRRDDKGNIIAYVLKRNPKYKKNR